MSYITYIDCYSGTRHVMHASSFHASFDATQVKCAVEQFVQSREDEIACAKRMRERNPLSELKIVEPISEKKKIMLSRADAVFVKELGLFIDEHAFIRNVRECTTLAEAIAYSKGSSSKQEADEP